MKLKETLAQNYANTPNNVDTFTVVDKLLMIAAYISGFNKAKELVLKNIKDKCDWVFEGANSGDKTVRECQQEWYTLREQAQDVKQIGEEEIGEPNKKG